VTVVYSAEVENFAPPCGVYLGERVPGSSFD